MSTTLVDAAYLPPPPPPIVPPAPRALGIWRALGWLVLAVIAALAGPFLYGIIVGVWNLSHPAQPMLVPGAHDLLLSSIVFAAMLAGFFAVIVVACRHSGWRPVDYLALTRPHDAFVRLGVVAFVVPLAVSLAAAFISAGNDSDLPKPGLELLLLMIGIMVVAPIAEELIFRGFLYRAVAESRLGVVVAIVLTALVWASLHTDKSWLGMADTFFAGLVWGWLRWRTQSTLVTIAVHALNNLVAGTGLAVAVLAGTH
jgi:hypothetical protein